MLVFGEEGVGGGVGAVSMCCQLMLCFVSVFSQSAIFCVRFSFLHGFLTGGDRNDPAWFPGPLRGGWGSQQGWTG